MESAMLWKLQDDSYAIRPSTSSEQMESPTYEQFGFDFSSPVHTSSSLSRSDSLDQHKPAVSRNRSTSQPSGSPPRISHLRSRSSTVAASSSKVTPVHQSAQASR